MFRNECYICRNINDCKVTYDCHDFHLNDVCIDCRHAYHCIGKKIFPKSLACENFKFKMALTSCKNEFKKLLPRWLVRFFTQ